MRIKEFILKNKIKINFGRKLSAMGKVPQAFEDWVRFVHLFAFDWIKVAQTLKLIKNSKPEKL